MLGLCVCMCTQGGIMFPDTAKLYMAPVSDSQCYDERWLFCQLCFYDKYNLYHSSMQFCLFLTLYVIVKWDVYKIILSCYRTFCL